jgi:NADPH:quinone reductase-like Zn-dependent oxidoreductase
MKAWFVRRYGGPDVLELADTPLPAIGAGQVLVRVLATTVSSGDARVRGCNLPPGMGTIGRLVMGWSRPRQSVLGTELAGVVEAVGEGVTRFARGDAVYAFPGGRMGAHAEYVAISQDGPIAHLPDGLGFNEAAALCFGGTTALHFLRKANLQRGETILVLGGSGAVGQAMIQLAHHKGAVVTATSGPRNLDLVRQLGADRVIDYTQTDPASLGERFDVIADTVGVLDFARAQNLLSANGRYLAIAGGMREMFGSLRGGPGGRRMIVGPAEERVDDVVELGRLAVAGICRPHIDQVYTFADLPAAHAHVDTGRKRGSVVVAVAE